MKREHCNGCVYWKSAGGYRTSARFCHHLLETGKRRVEVGGICRSRTPKEGKERA